MVYIREISASDSDVIADLHAQSWRTSYRGIILDSYLDGPIFEDFLNIWRDRLLNPAPEHLGLLALSGTSVVGFTFASIGRDDRWGTKINSLHVAPGCRGKGVGTRLLAALTDSLLSRKYEAGIYLWTFEANHPARQYYERLGAKAMEHGHCNRPGGHRVAEWLYAWQSVRQLQVASTSALADKISSNTI